MSPHQPPLSTPRLTLRDFTPADLDAYIELRRGAAFGRYYAPEEVTPVFSEQLLRQFVRQAGEVPRTKFQLAIEDRSGNLMGSAGLRLDLPGSRRASLGFELGEDFWGRGYALEACRTLLDFGRETLDLEVVHADIALGNRAAIAVAGKLGMRKGPNTMSHDPARAVFELVFEAGN